MKFAVRTGAALRNVAVEREAGDRLRMELDGKACDVDAVEIEPGTYSILSGGCVFEARVSEEPCGVWVRCGGREFVFEVSDPRAPQVQRGGVLEAQGRRQVAAPMPGKVVRVLVAAGDAVEADQGLLVIEAMKMQNEIRAPKKGIVERIFVNEGQAVAAGQPLVIVV